MEITFAKKDGNSYPTISNCNNLKIDCNADIVHFDYEGGSYDLALSELLSLEANNDSEKVSSPEAANAV